MAGDSRHQQGHRNERVDEVTGLHSLRWLQERFAEFWHERPHSIAVILLDIDGPHRLDELDGCKGRSDGSDPPRCDDRRRICADLIVANTRHHDDIVRLRNDEFLVLTDDTSPAANCRLAERLVTRLAEVDGLGLTACAGVATGSSLTPTAVLKDADCALAEARRRDQSGMVMIPGPPPMLGT